MPQKIWHEEIPMKMSCKKNEERHLGKKHLETQTRKKSQRQKFSKHLIGFCPGDHGRAGISFNP